MTGYKFKLTNSNGDYFYINDFVTDPLNFFALQDYPTFDVDIKNNESQKEGQHGIWDFFSFYGKRVVNFSGVIVGETEADVETLKLQLLKVISLPPIPSNTNDGSILITWTDANGDDWQISTKLQGYPRFSRGMKQGSRLYFTLTLKAKNPEIESQAVSTASGIRGWQSTSLKLPAVLPIIFGSTYQNTLNVTNGGAISVHTTITLHGETGGITNPYILNTTTGKLFKVNITLTDATKYIVIDSKNGTVVDQDGVDRSGLVDSASEYVMLVPGVNTLVYISNENPYSTLTDPSAVVSISHRETII